MSEETKVSVVGAPTQQPTQPTAQETADIDSIVDELEDEISEEEAELSDAPKSEQPAPAIDISKLTLEQLQELQARLSATPSRADSRATGKIIKIRMYRDQPVVDIGNAYVGLMDDPENNRKVERHIVPFKVLGNDETIHLPYRQFLQLEQVECEVLDTQSRTIPEKKGVTYNEHDELIEMMVTRVEHFFDIRLPSGKEIKIEGKVANA